MFPLQQHWLFTKSSVKGNKNDFFKLGYRILSYLDRIERFLDFESDEENCI